MIDVVRQRFDFGSEAALASATTTISGSVFDGEQLLEAHVVAFRGDKITAVLPRSRFPGFGANHIELNNEVLMPGFVDLQVNGGGGALFNDYPDLRTIATIGAAHRQFGTTGFLPTLVTDTFDVMRRAIDAVRLAIESGVPGVLGIHLEGPFLNPERAGVHDPARFRRLDERGFRLVTSLNTGVTLLTLAPELTDQTMIRRLANAGVVVCAGHSDADYDQAQGAVSAGLSGFTHLYNGMPPLQSREPGMVGAAIASPEAWFGIIADGHHVHPAAFGAAVKAKKRGGALLVTDAMPPVGTDIREFQLYGKTIAVEEGRCTIEGGGLAGSSLDMISAVNNATRFAGLDWFEAARMASLYPAKALGLDNSLGRIRLGYQASLIAVDDNFSVTRVWIDGKQYKGR